MNPDTLEALAAFVAKEHSARLDAALDGLDGGNGDWSELMAGRAALARITVEASDD
jgi:hypothetical protein